MIRWLLGWVFWRIVGALAYPLVMLAVFFGVCWAIELADRMGWLQP